MAGWEQYKVGRCLGGRMVRWLDGCAGVWARDGMRMGTMRERDRGREEMRGKASGKGSSWPTRTTEAHPTVRGERVSLLWCLRTDQSQGFLGDKDLTTEFPAGAQSWAAPSEYLLESRAPFLPFSTSLPPTSYLSASPSTSFHTQPPSPGKALAGVEQCDQLL